MVASTHRGLKPGGYGCIVHCRRLQPADGLFPIISSVYHRNAMAYASTAKRWVGNPADLPDPATISYGFDFNPAVDRLRVTTGSGQNFRLNPNTGAPVDGDLGGAAGSFAGVNMDGPINGGTTSIDEVAYTNNAPNTTVTTLYTLDSITNNLFIQNPPNVGTQTAPLALTLNGSPLDFTTARGFDIAPGVNAPASNAAATGTSFAILTVGGVIGLYRIELSTGAATLLGTPGTLTPRGLAIWSPLPIGAALSANGGTLLRFRMDTPGTTTNVATSGIVAGETLIGIDSRPATGQLYGLGVNATTNTATLYLIDPQTGAATATGSAGLIAFVDAGGNPVDLPDPSVIGYGLDFNPTVDRIRVTTGI